MKPRAPSRNVEDRRGEHVGKIERFWTNYKQGVKEIGKQTGLVKSDYLDVDTPFSRATAEGLQKWMKRRGGMRGRREGY